MFRLTAIVPSRIRETVCASYAERSAPILSCRQSRCYTRDSNEQDADYVEILRADGSHVVERAAPRT